MSTVARTTSNGTVTDDRRMGAELAALRAQLRESELALARMPALEREAELAAEDRKELDNLRTRVDVLEHELAATEAKLAGATTMLEELRERSSRVIDGMKSSLSWRITAPLRWIARALRRSAAPRD